jgi:hypothetical protein
MGAFVLVSGEPSAMSAKNAIRFSVLLIFLGLIGGAVRYWRWWPFLSTPYSVAAGILCPLCLYLDGAGADWRKFVTYTLVGGLFNAVPSLVVGWAVVGIFRLRKQRRAI